MSGDGDAARGSTPAGSPAGTSVNIARVQRRRKIAVLAFSVVVLALVLVTHSAAGSNTAWHETVDIAGAALIVLCILGRTWTSIYIAGSKRRLVVDIGPYSLVRNPLYVFSAIGAAGVGLTTGSVAIGGLLGLATLLIFHIVILSEENFLGERFPAEYADYTARVGRWIPKFSAWRDEKWVSTRPANIVTTFRDTCLFLLAVPAFELVEHLQDSGILPVLFSLP